MRDTGVHEVWFDTNSGQLAIGDEALLSLATDASSLVVPLADLVFANKFPYKKGDFEPANPMTPDEALVAGRGIAKVLITPTERLPLSRELVGRLNILGILPSVNQIKRQFGKLSIFCEQIGAATNRTSTRFEGITSADLVELVMGLRKTTSLDSPITKKELDFYYGTGRFPGYDFIVKNVGGLANLNEHLGFPDIRKWDETDYVQFGARLLKENGLGSLTARNLNKLSARRLGPSGITVIDHFGSISTFQNLASAEYARQSTIDAARSAAVEQHFMETHYKGGAPKDPGKRILIWGRYQVARACLKTLADSELTKIAKLENGDFVDKILRVRSGLSLADLEIMAVSLQVEDYIWPPINQ
jgi:acyl carrier protein